jgi:hypothetical protein
MGPPCDKESAVPTKRPVPITPPILDGGENLSEERRKHNRPNHGDVTILEFTLQGVGVPQGPLHRLSIMV